MAGGTGSGRVNDHRAEPAAAHAASEVIDWLHISDLHITAPEPERQRWVQRDLLRDLPHLLQSTGLKPRLLFVTGDVSNRGAVDEYENAYSFFRALADLLNLDPRVAFFFVPGNHDVDRRAILKAESLAQEGVLRREGALFRQVLDTTFGKEDELAPYGRRLGPFFDFTARLIGEERSARPGRPFCTDTRDMAGIRIGVASLCSAWMCGPDEDAKGRIVLSENQVRQALDELATAEADLRIVLLHHPLEWLHPAEDQQIREFLHKRAHLVMHGHLHATGATSSSSAASGYIVDAAGAAYAGSTWARGFSAGRFDPANGQLSIMPFVYSERGEGAWCPDTNVPGVEGGAAKFHIDLKRLSVITDTSLDVLVTRLARVTAEMCDRVLFVGLPSRVPRPDVRLSDLFVALDFDPIDPLPGARRIRLPQLYADLFGGDGGLVGKRFVVLGDPGSGKTTLCRHIAVRISELKPKVAPLLLVVRDYMRRGRQQGLLAFLAEEARQHYSLPVGSESFLQRLCQEGRAILLVDGLDEVDSPLDREDVRQKIESLALCYPALAVLVTSRYVGYDHGPLSQQEFRHLKLAPFDDAALKSFIDRWCRMAAHGSSNVGGDQKAKALWKALEADPRVKRLARQPFLATLIAMVQRGETRLPGDRAQLLDLFVETLVKYWPAASGRRFRHPYLDEGRQLALLQEMALGFLETPLGDGRTLPSTSRPQMADTIVGILRKRAAARGEAEYQWPVDDWLDWLTKDCGILIEQQPGQLSFLHPSIMSYLAGQALFARESPEGFSQVAALVRKYHRDPLWSEALLLMLGRHATDGRLVAAVFQELSAAAEECTDDPMSRLDTLTFLVAMLREEVDLPTKQVEQVLTQAARTATEVSNGHLTAASRWIGDVARHSYRHRDAVSRWFVDRVRQAGLLEERSPTKRGKSGQSGATPSELPGLVLLGSDTNHTAMIEALDSRSDRERAAGDLLEIWPIRPVGAWAKERADRAGILQWALGQGVGVTCWRAIACLEEGWTDGAAAQTIALLHRAAWLGHLHAPATAAPAQLIRWRLGDGLVEVPVAPAFFPVAETPWGEGSTQPVGAEQAQTFGLSFASGPVSRSYDLHTQRGFARGLSRMLGGELWEALSPTRAAGHRSPPEPAEIAGCVVDLLADGFEPTFASKLRALLAEDLGPAVGTSATRPLTIARAWQALTDDSHSTAGLIALVAAHTSAGVALGFREGLPAVAANLLLTLRLQNLWLNLFLDRIAERALDQPLSAEGLALLYALGLAQRQTTYTWPDGASWRAIFDRPPPVDQWLPSALWRICRLHDGSLRDPVAAAEARREIASILERADWRALAEEVQRHDLRATPLPRPSARTTVTLRLDGDSAQFSLANRQELQALLRTVSADESLSILEVRSGSVIITLEVTLHGAALLKRLVDAGELTTLLGYKIVSIEVTQAPARSEQTAAASAPKRGRPTRVRLLFLAANPVDTARLGLDEEVRLIQEKIRASAHRDRIEVVQRWATRPDDLLQALNQDEPDIVHFSGHGCENGDLRLVDRDGKIRAVSSPALRSLFQAFSRQVRLVVLNACYSELQATALSDLVDFTVGMSRSVSDGAAIVFAASLYRAIGFGATVRSAFDQGVAALKLEGLGPHDESPRLHVRPGVDASALALLSSARKRSPSVHVK